MNEKNQIPPSKTLLAGRKRVLALAVAAFAVVGLTGVGAIATSQTGITNNQFIKDAAPAGFTFTGTPFLSHYNGGSLSATETWTVANTASECAFWNGYFALKAPTDLPLAFAKHLKVSYTYGGGAPVGGGTLATPISVAAAYGWAVMVTPPGTTKSLGVQVTWDGTDPAPTQTITDIADFDVQYSYGI